MTGVPGVAYITEIKHILEGLFEEKSGRALPRVAQRSHRMTTVTTRALNRRRAWHSVTLTANDEGAAQREAWTYVTEKPKEIQSFHTSQHKYLASFDR